MRANESKDGERNTALGAGGSTYKLCPTGQVMQQITFVLLFRKISASKSYLESDAMGAKP